MNVDPPETPSEEHLRFEEQKRFGVMHHGGAWKRGEEGEDFGTSPEVSAGQLSDHEGVHPALAVTQPLRERVAPAAQMVDPDGRIDQHRLSAGVSGAGAESVGAPSLARRAQQAAWRSRGQ